MAEKLLDFKSLVDEMLEDVNHQASTARDWAMIRAMRRLQRRPVLRARLYEKLEEKARLDFSAEGVGAWGDGEFGKWFLDWFIENWPTIEKIILFVIKIII